jgi:hypothetical protein
MFDHLARLIDSIDNVIGSKPIYDTLLCDPIVAGPIADHDGVEVVHESTTDDD